MNPGAAEPREREIEVLGRLVRGVLLGLRILAALVGIGVIAGALWLTWHPEGLVFESETVPPLEQRLANNMAFVCLGLSLLLPTRWLRRASILPLLGAGAAAWFLPSLLPGDHPFGFVLRMFASSVGVIVLLLWRTLFGLTKPAASASS